MVGVLIMSQDIPSLRQWNPLYVTFSMVVVLSEKVRTAAVACVAMVPPSLFVRGGFSGSPCHPALESTSKASSLAAPCQHLRSHAYHSELSGLLQNNDGSLTTACLRP